LEPDNGLRQDQLGLRPLHGRAVRVAGEVRHLAIGGFESGATARQRSLHDIAVVSLILSEASEDIRSALPRLQPH